jgi:hypothetical protein
MMMNAGGKKLVFNPVLAAPWKTQTANCENPADLLCGQRNKRKSTQVILISYTIKFRVYLILIAIRNS